MRARLFGVLGLLILAVGLILIVTHAPLAWYRAPAGLLLTAGLIGIAVFAVANAD